MLILIGGIALNKEFQRFLNENRHQTLDIDNIILGAISKGIPVTYDDIYESQEYVGGRNAKLMVPKVVAKFFSMINQNKDAEILVTWDQYGEWLQSTNVTFRKIVLINKEEKQAKITSNLQTHENKDVKVSDPMEQLDNLSEKTFDVICGFPPLGIREVAIIKGEEFRGELSHIILLKSSKLLKKNGRIYFIVTESFFSRNNRRSIISKLEEENVYLESALYLPPGTFHPSTGIG